MLIKSNFIFLLNFFYFYKFSFLSNFGNMEFLIKNKFIFLLNKSSCLLILSKFNMSFIFLIGSFKKNPSWISFSFTPFKFYKNKLNFVFYSNFLKKKTNSKLNFLKTYIKLKKQVGFLKKKNKMLHYSLNRVYFFKNNFKFDYFFKKYTRNNYFNKYYDMASTMSSIFVENRFILKKLILLNSSRQFKITKVFSKILKGSFLKNMFFFETKLINLLIRSKLIFSINEALFFLKNGLVYLNGKPTYNTSTNLFLGDIVSLPLSKHFFTYNRINLNKKIKLINAVGYRIWRLNRFRNNFYKQSATHIPSWINKIMFFFEDAPSFLEIDYTVLSFIFLKNPSKIKFINFYFIKFINFYLMRLYNWKFVT